VTVETVIGLQGKPVDVAVDPAERQARGLPEKIDSSEYHFGTEATYLSEAESRIYDIRKEAEALAERAAKAEFAVDYDRAAAGLKFIELQALVKAEGHDWEDWFPKHVRGVTIRTAYRYMALARAPEYALSGPLRTSLRSQLTRCQFPPRPRKPGRKCPVKVLPGGSSRRSWRSSVSLRPLRCWRSL
jgi:hypothetical protein